MGKTDVPVKTEEERIVAMAEAEARAQGVLGDDAPPEEAPPEPTPEAQAEPTPPEAPATELPVKGSPEDPLKEPEVPKERMIPESVMQKRFDELTAEKHELRRELDVLKTQVNQPKPEKKNPNDDYTDEQLEQLIMKRDEEHPEYAVLAQRELNRRDYKRELDQRDAKRQQEDSTRSLQAQHQRVREDLAKQYPDLTQDTTELFQLTKQEYLKVPERKRTEWPDELTYAVARAKAQLDAKSNGKKSQEATRAAAAAKKGIVPLSGTTRSGAAITSEAQLEKLHQKAQESGVEQDWTAYLKASDAARKAKKKEE